MRIRDKLIASFLVLVFLLLVAMVVKFYAIRQTWKSLAALTEVAPGSEDEARAGAIRAALLERMPALRGLRADTAPLVVLQACRDLGYSLRTARQGLCSLQGAAARDEAVRARAASLQAVERLVGRAALFAVSSAEELGRAEAVSAFPGPKPDFDTFAALLRRLGEPSAPLGEVGALKEHVAAASRALAEGRFELAAGAQRAQDEALRALDAFEALRPDMAALGVADPAGQYRPSLLALLSARDDKAVRESWGALSNALGALSPQLPPPGSHPKAGALGSSLDALQRALTEFVKARLGFEKNQQAGAAAILSFEREATTLERRLGDLEGQVTAGLAKRLGGAAGAADELGEQLVSAVDALPPEVLTRGRVGAVLQAAAARRQFEAMYDQQLGDLTFTTVLFVLGVVLAIALSFLVYRDFSQPLDILRTSLNNLCMGGEKRRINLKIHNEMGSLIEAYNRYLDNLTSSSKRLVECPSCRNPYEMGDSFCRQCGRKLRFDS